jgi:uncharacterized protein YyaL (SSP411 family)
MGQGKNQLGVEVSPYLLQHAHNPIWWFAWGDEAFVEAQRLDVPVFLSIGYSTCYWCHVMEKECFEHMSVAQALNGKFISIKVDREERPDVDQIYMDALVGMTGHGGWPMSVFLTPDRRPFWAGTYIPREQFLPLLREVSSRWHSDRDKIEEAAERVTDAIQFESREVSTTGVKPLETAEQAVRESLARYDTKWGGFGGAPKFPSAQLLQLFTHVYRIQGGDDIRAALEHTLERMAAGGIYDHVGGGFSRYSVDDEWRVPHFEKMLYDNALLALTYLKAGQVLRRDDLLEVAREILDYLERDMRSSETGAYYAAEDAGAVGSEGEFYLWQHDELKSALSTDEFLALSQRFEILPKGNFEGRTVFFLKQFSPWKSRFPGQSLETLRKHRSYRDRPHRDTKILIGWNGLALRAFVEASFIFQSSKYRDLAVALGSFLVEIGENNELCTSYAGGVRRGGIGCLEDYAFVIAGLIDLFELTGSAQWLLQAYHYQRKQDEHFWSEQEGLYRYSVAPDLIVERYPLFDSPTPNGNGVSFSNVYRLSLYFWDEELRLRSERLQRGFQRVFEQVPSAVPTAVMGALGIERGKELVIVAPERKRQEVVDEFAPYRPQLSLFAVLSPEEDYSDIPALRAMSVQHEDDEIFYLCEQGRCLTPSRDRGEMRAQLLEDK